jgi:ribosomal protein S1
LGYIFTDTELNTYLNKINKIEKKQDMLEHFIDAWNRWQTIKIDDVVEAIILQLKPTGAKIYIASINYKCMLHISKLSPIHRLTFVDNKLINTEVNLYFARFDRLQLRITQIFFDIIEFITVQN